MRFNHIILCALLVSFLLLLNASAEIPGILNYQGRVTGRNGSPIADGNYQMQFKIYGSLPGTNVLWSSSTVTAPVNDGPSNIYRLEVSGAAVIGSSYFGSETAPSNGLLVEGDVGIGLTNPNRKLYILPNHQMN
ncbi:MAG: hypothetical protein GWO10_08220 [candidate division Zixibacteria bacterium]|nr:hypothetical protein [candidate division Zixibacteria bacterium]NIS14996.1 hypothetical protein [candidate division Zixibacteria bacterium]NIW39025.1 hypothetical protein [candidate division Zixibacteria bacterium]